MVNPAKIKGSAFEVALVNLLRGAGYEWDVERMTLNGAADEGDIIVREGNGLFTVIEAKATKALTAAQFMKEALIERDNWARKRSIQPDLVMPLVVWKSPGKSIDDALVITNVREMFAR